MSPHGTCHQPKSRRRRAAASPSAVKLLRIGRVPRQPSGRDVDRLTSRCGNRLHQIVDPDHRDRLRHRLRAPTVVPAAQNADRTFEPLTPRVSPGQRVIGLDQRGDQLGETGLIAVECCRLQALQGPAAAAGQQLQRMHAHDNSPRTCPYISGSGPGRGCSGRRRGTASCSHCGPSHSAGSAHSAARQSRATRPSRSPDRCRRPAWCNRSGRRASARTADEDRRSRPYGWQRLYYSNCSPAVLRPSGSPSGRASWSEGSSAGEPRPACPSSRRRSSARWPPARSGRDGSARS